MSKSMIQLPLKTRSADAKTWHIQTLIAIMILILIVTIMANSTDF
jgi:hypothetical protein